MKMKYIAALLLTALVTLLSACSGADVVCVDNTADVKKPHIRLSFPDGFSVTAGKNVYKELYELMSDEYGSVNELRKEFEDNGENVLVRACSDDVNVLLAELEKGDFTIADFMQSLHNNSVFEYRASGYFTESSLEETEWGGAVGVMSVIRVYEEQDSPLISEEREFCFERSDKLYSLQLNSSRGFDEQVNGISLEIYE